MIVILFVTVDISSDIALLRGFTHCSQFQIETADVSSEDRETKLFPEQHMHNISISAHVLTSDFLIYATDVSNGKCHY